MRALSLSRPWDYVILHHPFKDIENRNWSTQFRGRILVHRAKSWDEDGIQWLWLNRHALHIDDAVFKELRELSYPPRQGEIVGEVDIVDCVSTSSSPWFFGKYGLVLSHPTPYNKPIPYRGKPGLFEVNLDELDRGHQERA